MSQAAHTVQDLGAIHAVRGTYLAVSFLVFATALYRGVHSRFIDIEGRRQHQTAAYTLAAYACSIGAAQVYAFSKPLTIGTAYISIAVIGGLGYLVVTFGNWWHSR